MIYKRAGGGVLWHLFFSSKYGVTNRGKRSLLNGLRKLKVNWIREWAVTVKKKIWELLQQYFIEFSYEQENTFRILSHFCHFAEQAIPWVFRNIERNIWGIYIFFELKFFSQFILLSFDMTFYLLYI